MACAMPAALLRWLVMRDFKIRCCCPVAMHCSCGRQRLFSRQELEDSLWNIAENPIDRVADLHQTVLPRYSQHRMSGAGAEPSV